MVFLNHPQKQRGLAGRSVRPHVCSACTASSSDHYLVFVFRGFLGGSWHVCTQHFTFFCPALQQSRRWQCLIDVCTPSGQPRRPKKELKTNTRDGQDQCCQYYMLVLCHKPTSWAELWGLTVGFPLGLSNIFNFVFFFSGVTTPVWVSLRILQRMF